MRYIYIATLIIAIFSAHANSETYNLTRSISTSDESGFPFVSIQDTLSKFNAGYEHTGTITIENGILTFDTLLCISNICVRNDSSHKIIGLTDNQDSAIIEDGKAKLGARIITILSLQPNLMIMETAHNGDVLITEWQKKE